MNTSSTTATTVSAILTTFLADSVAHIVPWLLVCVAVIGCDLIFGLRKSVLMGETVRFSRACRNTLGKTLEYFAFVVMVCFVNTAAGGEYSIDKWACLMVCFIEGCSIIGNLLKPKGINLDLGKLLSAVGAKITGISKADLSEAITSTSDGLNSVKTPENTSDGHSTNTNQ